MRINTPVTNVEYELRDDAAIVSKTDTRGIITYVNADFIESSGFSEKELIGQPHNVVRHPDMPEEAFADLWRTLKAGKPWTGIVKNRRKNGDHYWVVANATPIYENGALTGYMSSRTKPSRDAVEAHAAAYRLFKEGRQGGMVIREGKVAKGGASDLFAGLSLRTRLLLAFGFLAALLLLVGAMGTSGMRDILADTDAMFAEGAAPLSDVSRIAGLVGGNGALLRSGAQESVGANLDEYARNDAEIRRLLADLAGRSDGAARAAVDGYRAVYDAAAKEAFAPEIEALRTGKTKDALRLSDGVAAQERQLRQAAERLGSFYADRQKHLATQARERFDRLWKLLLAAVVGGVVLAFAVGFSVVEHLVRSLRQACAQLGEIAQGRYFNKIDVERDDEIGKLMYAMKSMQIRMGFEVSDARRTANEAMRVKVALDNVGTGVMIADRNRDIIYLNQSVIDLLSKAENDLRKVLPDFSASNLLGVSMDRFHRNPAHQQQLLEHLRGTHSTEIALAGRTFALTACPVINERGERLGSAIEWRDRTAEVAVEHEIATIVHAAADGDFSQRIGLEGKDGFFRQIAEGMNSLMQTSATSLDEVVRVLGALAKGDLTETISNEYRGTFGQLKTDANSMVEQLTEVIKRLREAGNTINMAAKEIASGNTDLSQRTEEQASSLEETAASMEELTSAVRQNTENARQANQLASGASDIAAKGGEVVGQVVHTMSSISESSKKIVDIIGVIDGIAFQTNILALNAAVEAARAGEQGRGFAVVASEVRSLAQRSAAAAKEIKALINDSVDKVATGAALADKAGRTMEEVVGSVRRVTDIMAEISAASVEQSSGIEQVNQAISQMDDVTQQNAALVEQAAAAAEALEEQAQELSELISTFRLSDGDMAELAAPVTVRPSRVLSAPARTPAVRSRPLPRPSPTDDDEWKEF